MGNGLAWTAKTTLECLWKCEYVKLVEFTILDFVF